MVGGHRTREPKPGAVREFLAREKMVRCQISIPATARLLHHEAGNVNEIGHIWPCEGLANRTKRRVPNGSPFRTAGHMQKSREHMKDPNN